MKKRLFTVLCLLVLGSILLASCGRAGMNESADSASVMYDMNYKSSADMEYYSDEDFGTSNGSSAYIYSDSSEGSLVSAAASAEGTSSSIADTRKIIRTEELTLETKTFDQAVADITASVEGLGGYIESSYVSGNSLSDRGNARYASFTLRIPSASLNEYVGYIETSFHVTSRSSNASDITDSYYDAEARLKSLLTQEERLLAMLEGADELQYMLQLEDKLADVRYRIESYNSTLQRYDKQVELSTVTIALSEVMEYQPVSTLPRSFGERISLAIANSWDNFVCGLQDLTIDLMYALPGIICFVVIVLIVVLLVRLSVKGARKRRAKRLASSAELQRQRDEALSEIKASEKK